MLQNYVVLDMEMTGLSAFRDKIIEMGAVRVREGKVESTFQTLVNPNMVIPEKIVEITGISNEMVKGEPYIGEVLQDFLRFLGSDVLIGHNLRFDFSFIKQAAYEAKEEWWQEKHWGLDTLKIARGCLAPEVSKKLTDLCALYKIVDGRHHRALSDAVMTEQLYRVLCHHYETQDCPFTPEELCYKPKKEREPSRKELQRVEKLLKTLGKECEQDIRQMSQSELSRYADYLLTHRS